VYRCRGFTDIRKESISSHPKALLSLPTKAGKKIFVEEISGIKYYSRITGRFGKQVSRLTAITTNQEAGWYLGLDDEKVY
jgi:hypothetical protein